MQLQKYVIWTFVALILGVVLLFLIPTPGMLAFGTMVLPLLILLQAFLILRTKDVESKKFNEDDWYEHL